MNLKVYRARNQCDTPEMAIIVSPFVPNWPLRIDYCDTRPFYATNIKLLFLFWLRV